MWPVCVLLSVDHCQQTTATRLTLVSSSETVKKSQKVVSLFLISFSSQFAIKLRQLCNYTPEREGRVLQCFMEMQGREATAQSAVTRIKWALIPFYFSKAKSLSTAAIFSSQSSKSTSRKTAKQGIFFFHFRWLKKMDSCGNIKILICFYSLLCGKSGK